MGGSLEALPWKRDELYHSLSSAVNPEAALPTTPGWPHKLALKQCCVNPVTLMGLVSLVIVTLPMMGPLLAVDR